MAETLPSGIKKWEPSDPVNRAAFNEQWETIDRQLADMAQELTKKVAKGDFVLNVKDFEAVGDGVKDDTAAINAALLAAHDAGGGIVYVPDGNYKLTSQLTIWANTTLILHPAAVMLRGANYNPMLLNGPRDVAVQYTGFGGQGNIKIIGGTWDAQGHTYNSVTGQPMAFGHGENILIQETRILNSYGAHAIEFNGCKNVRFINVDIAHFYGARSGNGLEAIQIDYMNTNGVSWPSPPWFGSLDETLCEDILIQGCTIRDFPRGIGTHASVAGHYKNIRIVDCHMEEIDFHAIRMENWLNIIVSNCTMINVGAGIELFTTHGMSSGECIIANCVVDMTGKTPTNSRGIWLNGNPGGEWIYNVELVGNVIRGANEVGVRFEYTKNSSIIGGSITNNNSHGITFVSSEDNRIEGVNTTFNKGSGVLLFNSNRNSVRGVTAHHNNTHGISMDGSSDNVISSNLSHSNNQEGGQGSNLRITNVSLRNNVQGNTCRQGSDTNKPLYGVSLTANSTGNIVTNNDLLDSGSSGALENPSNVAVTTAGNRVS